MEAAAVTPVRVALRVRAFSLSARRACRARRHEHRSLASCWRSPTRRPLFFADEYIYSTLAHELATTGRPTIRGEAAELPRAPPADPHRAVLALRQRRGRIATDAGPQCAGDVLGGGAGLPARTEGEPRERARSCRRCARSARAGPLLRVIRPCRADRLPARARSRLRRRLCADAPDALQPARVRAARGAGGIRADPVRRPPARVPRRRAARPDGLSAAAAHLRPVRPRRRTGRGQGAGLLLRRRRTSLDPSQIVRWFGVDAMLLAYAAGWLVVPGALVASRDASRHGSSARSPASPSSSRSRSSSRPRSTQRTPAAQVDVSRSGICSR